MFFKPIRLVISLFLILLTFGCKSEINSPAENQADALQMYKFETVESDLGLLKDGGMIVPIPEGDAVFSIGWNEIFRPVNDDSLIKGMAFAVAFGNKKTESLNFPRFGIDMGTINIGYADNQIKMHKMFHHRRGTAYSLFNRPFGDSDTLLEYIPNSEYTFDVSGSQHFSPVIITLMSPASLINITNHNHGDIIDPQQDLSVVWDGGNPEEKIAIQIMPHFIPQPGGNGSNGGGKHGGHIPPPPGPPPGRAIVIILDNNPGQYTITSAQLQNIISEFGCDKIVVGVSQFDLGEVAHDGKVLHTAMRNGNSVMLKFQ
jgi:hypothetical protein